MPEIGEAGMTNLLALLDQAIDGLVPADSSRCSRSQAGTRTSTGTGKPLKKMAVPVVPASPVLKRKFCGDIVQPHEIKQGEYSAGPEVAHASTLQKTTGTTGTTGTPLENQALHCSRNFITNGNNGKDWSAPDGIAAPECVTDGTGFCGERNGSQSAQAAREDLMDAYEERAAIAEFEGGLDRDAAERLAWAEVTGSLEGLAQPEQLHTGPAGDDAVAWRAWMRSRISVSRARGLTTADAVRSVWSEAEDRWHRQHGATPDPDRCAGCGEWMLDGPGMMFDDGAVVHFGNPDRLGCLIIYGEAWRAAASAGLVALGLRKPQP
jgi:hypothetical protein